MSEAQVYNAKQIGWELERTALGDGYFGSALRAAMDFACITPSEKEVLQRYATGDQGATDHVTLQEIAIKVYQFDEAAEVNALIPSDLVVNESQIHSGQQSGSEDSKNKILLGLNTEQRKLCLDLAKRSDGIDLDALVQAIEQALLQNNNLVECGWALVGGFASAYKDQVLGLQKEEPSTKTHPSIQFAAHMRKEPVYRFVQPLNGGQ